MAAVFLFTSPLFVVAIYIIVFTFYGYLLSSMSASSRPFRAHPPLSRARGRPPAHTRNDESTIHLIGIPPPPRCLYETRCLAAGIVRDLIHLFSLICWFCLFGLFLDASSDCQAILINDKGAVISLSRREFVRQGTVKTWRRPGLRVGAARGIFSLFFCP